MTRKAVQTNSLSFLSKHTFRSCFGNEDQTEVEGEDKKDPILQYLHKYYNGNIGTELLDSSTVRKLGKGPWP